MGWLTNRREGILEGAPAVTCPPKGMPPPGPASVSKLTIFPLEGNRHVGQWRTSRPVPRQEKTRGKEPEASRRICLLIGSLSRQAVRMGFLGFLVIVRKHMIIYLRW